MEKGLPVAKSTGAPFGFPMVSHPHDRGTVSAVPLVGDYNRVTSNGAMAVFRTTNGGKRWERLSKGLPQKDAWFTVLRDGMRADDGDPAGIYVGTTTGQLYASRNDGDSWSLIADHLPQVQSVEAGAVGGGRAGTFHRSLRRGPPAAPGGGCQASAPARPGSPGPSPCGAAA